MPLQSWQSISLENIFSIKIKQKPLQWHLHSDLHGKDMNCIFLVHIFAVKIHLSTYKKKEIEIVYKSFFMNDKLILEVIENIKRKYLRLLTAQSKKLLI